MPLNRESIVRYVDRIAIDASDCYVVSQLIAEGNMESDNPELQQLRLALDFHRSRRSDVAFDSQPFEAQISWQDGSRYPPPLEDLNVEVKIWSDFGKTITDSLVKSRLCHLVWASQKEDKYPCALLAIEAYLNLLERESREDVYRSDDLGFALNIALQLNDRVLIEKCISKGVEWSENNLNSEDKSPGAIITILTILASLREEFRPENIVAMIDRAIGLFDDEPHLLQSLYEIHISIQKTQQGRQDYARKCVDVWLKAAATSSGIIRAANLEQALEQARAFRLEPEITRIMRQYQQVDLHHDMQEISVSTSISVDELENFLANFLNFDVFKDSFLSFGRHCPISRSHDDEIQSARDFLTEHPFHALTQTIRVDSDGRPEAHIRNEMEHIADRVATQAGERIQVWGFIARLILERIIQRWSPSQEEIRDYFLCETIPSTAANGLALGFSHFSKGDWESALLVTLPRIEEVLRHTAQFHGYSILIPIRNRIHKRNARENLDNLKLLGEEQIFRYLDFLLVNTDATNLRNKALHGLMGQASPEEAALVLHAAFALRARALDISDLESH